MAGVTILFITTLIFCAAGVVLLLKNSHLPSRIKKAEEYLKQGDDKSAGEIVKAILEKKKDYVPAKFLRARMLQEQKQYLLSIAEFNSIMQIPEFDRSIDELKIHYHLADLYHETKQWKKEIEEYRIILGFNPDDINANYRIGLSLYKQKNYRDAKDTLLKAVSMDPSLFDCFLPLGISCYFTSDYDNSEKFLLRAIETPLKNQEAHYYLGLIFKGKKDYDNAILSFERAKTDSMLYRKSLMKIAEIYYDTANYDKAIEILEQGLNSLKAREEESLEYRYLLAECYELDNKVQEALHHWEMIEKEHPNYRSTQLKIDEYRALLENQYMKKFFTSSLEETQPLIAEVIARLNYNIISKSFISKNKVYYKVYHTKRINEPPILIFFNRSTSEISEGDIQQFIRIIAEEKCKEGIYLTTSRYGLKAKSVAAAKNIELYSKEYLIGTLEKIRGKQKKE